MFDLTITYSLTVTDYSGATATDQVTLSAPICPGIDEQASVSRVSIYPNPADDAFHEVLFSRSTSDAFISMVAADGKTLFEKEIRLVSGINTAGISTSELPQGFYYVRIESKELFSIGKVIVRR